MKNKNSLVNDILTMLHELQFQDKLEILSNVFIKLGISNIINNDTDSNNIKNKQSVSANNVVKIIMDDIKKNGETMPNAAARQGLLMLTWLNKEKI